MCTVIDILTYAQNKRDHLGVLALATNNQKVTSRYWDACMVAKQFDNHYNYVGNNCWEYFRINFGRSLCILNSFCGIEFSDLHKNIR